MPLGAPQSGYREGLDEGKGETIQQGFNAGTQCRPRRPNTVLCFECFICSCPLPQALQKALRWAGSGASCTVHYRRSRF